MEPTSVQPKAGKKREVATTAGKSNSKVKVYDVKGSGEFTYVHVAARLLCCSDSFVRVLIDEGKLVAFKLGERGIRVSKQSIQDYINGNIITNE